MSSGGIAQRPRHRAAVLARRLLAPQNFFNDFPFLGRQRFRHIPGPLDQGGHFFHLLIQLKLNHGE